MAICDYSLQSVQTRKAAVGDKLKTAAFGTGTTGFTDPDAPIMDRVAVCLLPGTELAFAEPVAISEIYGCYNKEFKETAHTLARFRQINKDDKFRHHDALEFPDGSIVLLTDLALHQTVTVLQLPAAPMDEHEAEEQRRVEYAG
jgi:hypothetical protein